MMKFVYVVTGNENTFFVEQTWVSIWSLKYYNPDAEVIIATDKSTERYIKTKPELVKLCSDIISISFDDGFTEMLKSRWLKTKLRELIRGTFVYLDGDTIITNSLAELSNFKEDVGMILDMHVCFDEHYHRNRVLKFMKKIYGINEVNTNNYYNGGFFITNDTPSSRAFFNGWYDNWERSREKGWPYDQIALLKACNDFPGTVRTISGIYNCQLSYSLKYLYDAKLVHFQRIKKFGDPICLFYSNDIFRKIKEQGFIGEEEIEQIIHCKSGLSARTSPINYQEFRLLNSRSNAILKILYKLMH